MNKQALSEIEQKTLELCQVIANQEGFAELCGKLKAFLSDESLKFRFQSLNDLSHLFQQKQAAGLEITPDEAELFERQREQFIQNPIALNFLGAQEEVQQLQSVVFRQISKMWEVGRVPVEEDFAGECCNSQCGCE
jgi:cell fate (sporulation/competence/biofilm development) regulator YlbF (YheA/YmcA/DUF963 family)